MALIVIIKVILNITRKANFFFLYEKNKTITDL